MEDLIKIMKASLLFAMSQIDDSNGGPKKEVLLVKAGFSYRDAAEMLGKSEAAVQKTVSRARLATKDTES